MTLPLLVLFACSPSGALNEEAPRVEDPFTNHPDAGSPDARQTADAAADAPPASPVAPLVFENPVIPKEQGGVADPGVLRAKDGRYYMASTGGSRGMYPIRVSDDLVHWKHIGYVFPNDNGTTPAWIDTAPWAPELHEINGKYFAFFSAKSKATGKMALGIATSDAPEGPFIDRGSPILAESPIGAIDSHYFRDPADGRHYMLWKQESNDLPPNGTPLFIQELAPDAMSLVGTRVELMRNDLPWEANLVEGPWMVLRDGFYYLFYSANAFFDHRYATGVARSHERNVPLAEQLKKHPRFDKHGDPILSSTSNDCWQGPGHGSILTAADGRDYYIYHAWMKGQVAQGNPRLGMLDRVDWRDGWPSINDGKPSLGRCNAP